MALSYLRQQLPILHTPSGLLRASLAVAMHALDDLDPEREERNVRALADQVRAQCTTPSNDALLAHLHEVMFEQWQFCGNCADYYSPLNSYLPAVMQLRRGLPVTLCLIYRVVGAWVGLDVVGLNLPGHFLVGVRERSDGPRLIIDPFHRGQVLTPGEACRRATLALGGQHAVTAEHLVEISHKKWILRLLSNLEQFFVARGHAIDAKAMGEMKALVMRAPE